jgi:formate dehydrogenase subunit gamma
LSTGVVRSGAVGEAAAPAGSQRLSRFDRIERAVHWVNAALFAVLLATAAALYIPSVSALVGRREMVKAVHVYSGLALPVPLLVSALGPWGRRLRRDLGRINRWSTEDMRWLRSLGKDGFARLSKFNPGQKLNAAFTGGAALVMLATGSIMRWYGPFPLRWRTGATFVHDWVAALLAVAIAGHIVMALRDRDALRAMVRGWVPARWARARAPLWYAELAGGRTAQPEPVKTASPNVNTPPPAATSQ